MILRSDKVKKIRKDYGSARKAGKDHNESIIYCVEQNPNCTTIEFVYGIYPLHALSLQTESTEKQKKLFGTVKYLGGKQMWVMDKHRIAKDNINFPDHRIITVERELQELDGTIRKYQAEAFAKGEDALRKAEQRKKVRDGIDVEIQDYKDKARDKNLPKRQAAAKRKREKEIQESE